MQITLDSSRLEANAKGPAAAAVAAVVAVVVVMIYLFAFLIQPLPPPPPMFALNHFCGQRSLRVRLRRLGLDAAVAIS